MRGWFAVKRGITSHPIFEKRPDRAFVWLWMLETAAYQDTRQNANGRPVEVKRGQLLTSYRQIANATGVGVQVIRTLFDLLEGESAINTDSKTGRMLITICNYDKYQSPQHKANTPSNTQPTHSQHTKETREQINNIPTSSADADAGGPKAVEADPINEAVWKLGGPLLEACGAKRSVIGKWLKGREPMEVLSALRDAKKAGTQDPVPYISAILNGKKVNRQGNVVRFPEYGPEFENILRGYGM